MPHPVRTLARERRLEVAKVTRSRVVHTYAASRSAGRAHHTRRDRRRGRRERHQVVVREVAHVTEHEHDVASCARADDFA